MVAMSFRVIALFRLPNEHGGIPLGSDPRLETQTVLQSCRQYVSAIFWVSTLVAVRTKKYVGQQRDRPETELYRKYAPPLQHCPKNTLFRPLSLFFSTLYLCCLPPPVE